MPVKSMEFERKVVLVTGGCRNTGLVIVKLFASDGARACQGARLVMDSGSSIQLYPTSCEDDTSTVRFK